MLIPCFNYGRFLADAIDSALAQQGVEATEVLVVNDGSSDDTPKVVARYGDRVRFLQQPNSGVCVALNRAASEATGAYVVPLDADDQLAPDFCRRTRDVFEAAAARDPRVAFAYTQRRLRRADGREEVSRFPDYSLEALRQQNYIMATSLIRRDVMRAVGYDPAFRQGLSDYDFYLALAARGRTGIRVDEPLVLVRAHGNSMSTACADPALRRQLIHRLLKKHAGLCTAQDGTAHEARWRNMVRCRVQERRRTAMPRRERWRDLYWLLRARAPLGDVLAQTRHAVAARDPHAPRQA